MTSASVDLRLRPEWSLLGRYKTYGAGVVVPLRPSSDDQALPDLASLTPPTPLISLIPLIPLRTITARGDQAAPSAHGQRR
jgi:hypothetical protein